MIKISAPYRFVPLSNLIVYPDWADKVSHDKPFKDGVSGELIIELENHTPMCVGGIQEASTDNEPGKIYFYKTPDNKPAIAATSLKGMLRNVLEIASFSRMKQVEDQKLGVRDLTESDNFYMTKIKNPSAGWLTFDNEKGWVIYPCSYARVHQQKIIDTFNIKYGDWEKSNTIMSRYDLLGIYPTVFFEDTEEKNNKKLVDIFKDDKKDDNKIKQGNLVVTGQPGQAFNKGKSAKKYEFVFHNVKSIKEVSPTVMSGFHQIHQDTKEWQYWQKNLNRLTHGIPVFYHSNGNVVRSLGLAMMYKLSYENSIHDAISHTNSQHIKGSKADMSDLLFGYISEDDSVTGLRGRVQVGMAEYQGNTPELKFSSPVVLSSPKPTYYPAYIYQNKGGKFSQLMQDNARIAGWKRYQVKKYEKYPILNSTVLQNKKVQVKLETIESNSKFSFKIRLHNLRPVELGALLWTLDFGGSDNCYHTLGMGKPFGLGRVKLKLTDGKLKPNDQSIIEDLSLYLQACQLEFKNFMNQAFKVNGVDDSIRWEDSETIQALKEYATPTDSHDGYNYLSDPKDFVKLKKENYINDFVNEFHKFSAVDIKNPKDIEVVEYNLNIQNSIEQVKAQVVAKEEALARAELKKTASEQDRVLLEIEDFIAKAKQEITDTMKKNAHKVLKQALDLSETFTDEQQIKLKQLAHELHDIIGSNKQLDKIVAKIR